MKKLLPITGILILLLAVSVSCKKKHVQPEVPVQEVSKYELIPGNYEIYDTLGNYLYDMEIKHYRDIGEQGYMKDFLEFFNVEEQYNFAIEQPNVTPTNYHKNYFYTGIFDPLLNSDGKRTFYFGSSAYFSNDSIYLDYKINNTKYYLSDMVPYYGCQCKRIGVKQH